MKALTIVNPVRLAIYGRVLDSLVSKNVVSSWYGISIKSRKRMLKYVGYKYKDKITYIEGRFFKDSRAAKDYLYSLRSKYSFFDFGTILAAEKYVPKYFPNGITDIANMVRIVEKTINDDQPDILISDFPSSALDMTAYQICKSKNIPTIFLGAFRIRNRLFFCYEPEKGLKEYITYHYHKYKADGLSEEKRKRATEYLNFFKTTKAKPSYYNFDLFRNRNLSILSSSGKIKSIILDLLASPSNVLLRGKNQIDKIILRKEWGKIFVPIDERDRIIFFPVQYQPEASTYVRSPYFKNQYSLIENLCIAIPAGYTLYVKEHYRHIWRKSASLFKEYMKRFPNLKFLDLSVDSHEIIKKSKLVVVLSSTAGWEAFLYGIPVLQFGRAFYSEFKGIYQFQTYKNLSSQIEEILEKHCPDEEEILIAIASALDGTLPGNINNPRLDTTVLTKENLNNIANAIIRGIEFYPQWQAFRKVNISAD